MPSLFMIFLINASLLFTNIKSEEEKEKLVFVVVHFRHGARAPQRFYKGYKDYAKEEWKIPGELTPSGERMLYLLGLRNHYRYIEDNIFLSSTYDPHELLVYSSRLNRTLISASSHLQGLYPFFSKEKDHLLNENELEFSFPQVNLSDERIQKNILELNNNSLPNNITLIPIYMISDNDKKIILFDIPPCTEKRDKIKKKNEKLKIMQDLEKEFNDNYGENLKNFYEDKPVFDLNLIDSFCDAFISDYINGRPLEELQKTNIEFTEVLNYCYKFQANIFYNWFNGNGKKDLAYLEVSKFMKEILYFMEQRVKADQIGEKIEEKYEDYSRPKMLIISGHDSTTSMYEIFLQDVFEKNPEFYKATKFTTQITFEVTTSNDNNNNKTDKDYFVNYYFDDERLLRVTMAEFVEKVSQALWDDKKINKFCGFEESDSDIKKIALIILICTTAVFLITTIILLIMLINVKKKGISSTKIEAILD